MKRFQEVAFETDCKNLKTALKRFEKKHPNVFEVWGEHFEYMIQNGQIYDDAKNDAGYVLWAIQDDDHYYFCFIAFAEYQVI